ncbi:lipoprotein [Pseudofrankia inefficax]|uniref:Lipoprotein n=1 Tax=Pseudofrankia inefficax (strain DSM 45817 / CECT 9037 / DDB 130130 / EuI1c) TaxID=298654 RepID=E3J6Q1_PSEI1|nr:lipoprotein [Pseudofrankia inefficax]
MAMAPSVRARTAAGLALIAVAAAACGSTPAASGGAAAPAATGAASATVASTPTGPATESNPAGDIPDSQAFVTYAPPGGPYGVEVPEGWARTASAGGVTFSDKYNRIVIAVSKASPTDPVAYARSTELAAVRAATNGFAQDKVSSVRRSAGEAVLITYRAVSPPNPVTGKVAVEDVERYEFFRGGTEVALTLAAPVGSDNVDPWRRVTDSFRWR